MSQIITIHSFRRAAGKSSLAVNLCALLAGEGFRAAAVDTDFQSPSLHLFFGLPEAQITHTFNHFMLGRCEASQTAYDLTHLLGHHDQGQLYLVPASVNANDILRMLRTGYDLDLLNDRLQQLSQTPHLDFLVLDTTAGLNENTLLSIALTTSLVVLLHPEQQDYQGTAVTVEVARDLGVSRLFLALNDAPGSLDSDQAALELQKTYHSQAAVLLPHSERMLALASGGVLALHDRQDPYVLPVNRLIAHLNDSDLDKSVLLA